jgi:hypothetical protein
MAATVIFAKTLENIQCSTRLIPDRQSHTVFSHVSSFPLTTAFPDGEFSEQVRSLRWKEQTKANEQKPE